jgi:hypothetical protein
MHKALFVSALVLTSLGSTGALARDRSAVPLAEPVGKSVTCVPLSQIRSTNVYGDSVIDFHMAGGKVLRNTLPMSCPGLGFEERFSYRTSIGQLCSVDIITVVQSPGLSHGPSCGLGEFQPVKIVKTATR